MNYRNQHQVARILLSTEDKLKKIAYALSAALLFPLGALAQGSCQSFDTGQYPLGHILSQHERQELSAQGPGTNARGTLQCSRDGLSCSVLASDGAIYGWREDGMINSKSFVLSAPSELPGWRGQFDQALADHVSNRTCSPFLLETSDSGISANDKYLKNESQKTQNGQGYATTIFGHGTVDDPITIQMNLTP